MPQAISAGHQTTLQTAKEILKAGGNAFDAAVAAHLAMFVAEPCMASAGGGGFALTFQPNKGVQFIDFFCHTPRVKDIGNKIDFLPIEVDFGKDTEQFYVGAASVATPGTMAGLFHLQANYGSMPFRELAAIPIQLAKEGVPVDKFQAIDFVLLDSILGLHEEGRSIFYKDGQVKKEHDIVRMPEMADFLDFMAREGVDAFYKGEISKNIADNQIENHGFLRRSDFENYQVCVTAALQFDYKNMEVYTANNPSIGGVILGNYLKSSSCEGNAKLIKRLNQHILDIPYQLTEFDGHYQTNLVKNWKANLSTKGTSHFNIVDKWGNAIALTTSIGEGNGSFIPKTQMQLNNMLGELFLLPAGAHSWKANARLNSMMTPSIVLDHQNELSLVLGSGGASRIPFAIGQTLKALLDKNLNLAAAIRAPRMHYHQGKIQVELEEALDREDVNYVNIWNQLHMFFGGVHSIYKKKNSLDAFADPRRYGVAEVF